MVLRWVFPVTDTFWDAVPLYWHNWPLPFFKHFPQLLWHNIFLWLCGLLSLAFSVSYFLSCPDQCPSSALRLLLPLLTVPVSPSTRSSQLRQMVPSLALLMPASWRESGHDFGTWWTVAQTMDKRVRQVTLTMVPHHPTSPLVFLPASKIPILYSFLIKPVQQKSWLLYTVKLMF